MYILTEDFDWFGELLPKGTIYIKSAKDDDIYICYKPNSNLLQKSILPNNIKDNEYFIEIDDIRMYSIIESNMRKRLEKIDNKKR